MNHRSERINRDMLREGQLRRIRRDQADHDWSLVKEIMKHRRAMLIKKIKAGIPL